MSTEPTAPAAGLSAASMAAAPAWVRRGSPELQRDYALGVQFEALLSQQMASAMDATAGLGEAAGGEAAGGEEAEGGSATPGAGVFSTLLSGALSQGVTDGGGLGVAAELARDMQSRSASGSNAAAATPLAGGTQAQTTGGTSS